MCTCCQGWRNGGSTTNGIATTDCYNGAARTGCVGTRTGCGYCGDNSVCVGGYNTCGTARMGCACGNGCQQSYCGRYISFPMSGTGVVPVSSIYFYPTSWGNSCGYLGGQTNNASNGGCANSCGFGRCGGAAAIANYYEDYYARQYGLND